MSTHFILTTITSALTSLTCLSLAVWPVLDCLIASHYFLPHWEKEVKSEKPHTDSILERKVTPCGLELTKPGTESWCSSGTQSHGIFNFQAAWVYNDLQISEDPYKVFYQTVICLKFEYFIAKILEVLARLLL